VPTLLRMAAPGLLLAACQAVVAAADMHFVGRLGTHALAGIALVFPLVTLLQMLSAGAVGGGVSSATSRALGAGDFRRVRAVAVHAVVIALGAGLLFTGLLRGFGPAIYRLLGGQGPSLSQALDYSHVLFGGALLVWLANTFASLLRGTGNMLLPAVAMVLASALQVPLSAALVLGLAGLPAMGVAGAAVAYLAAFGLAGVVLLAAVLRPRSVLRPRREDLRLRRAVFADILRVGGLSSLSALQTVLTAVVLTGYVGTFGTAALAGFGVGVRLELLQLTLVFAMGQALVVLVGRAVGARHPQRGKRIAWTGALIAALPCLAIGLTVALAPGLWSSLFSADPAVRDAAGLYLRWAGPLYPVLAVGIALYFASQGAGHVLWPVLGASTRLLLVAGGGYLLVTSGAPLWSLFALIAAAMLAYATVTGIAVARARW
jgi:putative MATE family efflux protein